MRCPVNYIGIVRGFKNSGSNKHYGVDFGWNANYGGKNQPIYACDDGIVIYNKVQKNGGKVINIRHNNGYVSEYAHLDNVIVKTNQKVTKGQQIALMGKTGNTTGNHLHFGLYKGSSISYSGNYLKNYVNPLKYINVYDNQVVGGTTAKNYKLLATKKALNIPNEPLLIRNKANSSGVIVGKIYNNDEVETYGTSINGWNVVDNIRGYYCFNGYLKED